MLTSFVLSPCVVKVPGTVWVEPALFWLIISMPTGSRKTTVYQFMRRMLEDVRRAAGCTGIYKSPVSNLFTIWLQMHITDSDPAWLLQDATFEKMGVIMAENKGRLLAMFDELSAFLTKIKLYNSVA